MKDNAEVNMEDLAAHDDDQSKLNNSSDQTRTGNENLIFGVEDDMPWPTLIVSTLQQFFYCIGGIASSPVILMPLICYNDSQAGAEYRTIIAGTCLVAAGISTFIQSTFGIRLPTMQATAVVYLVSIISVLNMDEWSCPVEANYGKNTSSIHDDSGFRNTSFAKGNTSLPHATSLKYYLDKDGVMRTSDEVWMRRIRMIQGSVIIVGLVQILIGVTGAIGYVIRFIGPLTVAPTLVMITYSLIDLVITLCSDHWGLASLCFGIYYITSVIMQNVLVPIPSCSIRKTKLQVSMTRSPIFSLYPVLYSFVVGWIAYLIILNASQESGDDQNAIEKLSSTRWFWMPYPFQFGWPIFTASGILGVMVALVPGILESLGFYSATAVVCQQPPPPPHVMNRGILVEGIAICTFGLLGSGNGSTVWTTQTALIAASKVGSRRVFQLAALLLIVFGAFTKSLGFFALLPMSVVGGVLLGAIGTIFSIGVTCLKHVNMSSNRNMFVLGISIMTGIGLPKYFSAHPDVVDFGSKYAEDIALVLLRSPMLIGGLTGLIFDNISPGSRKDRGLETFLGTDTAKAPSDSSTTNTDVYKFPFNLKSIWKRRASFFRDLCSR